MATTKRKLDAKKPVVKRDTRATAESPMSVLAGSQTVASLIQFFATVGIGQGVATPEIERRVGVKRTALHKGLNRLEKAQLIRHWTVGRTHVYAASDSAYWEPLAKMANIESRAQLPAFEGGFPWLAGKLAGSTPVRQARVLRLETTDPLSIDATAAALTSLPEVPEATIPRLARAPRPRH